MLQAIKFTDKRVPGLHLDLDEDFQTAGCFTEVIRGYKMGVVEPNVMRGLQPAGATIPSPTGLTSEKWKQTAMLCPLDWPSNYSLLRLTIVTCSLIGKSIMTSLRAECSTSYRPIMFRKPRYSRMCRIVISLAGECVKSHLKLTSRSSKRNVELRRFAATQEQNNPVSFALDNSLTATLKSDKLHFLEHTTQRMT